MKIAKFKSLNYSYETVHGDGLENSDEFVRVSEFVEVEFPPLTSDEQIQKAVVALDRQREKTVEDFGKKLAEIDRRKAEILSITHQTAEG